MYKTKSKISILAVLMLLCVSGFGADAPNDSVEDYWLKRYVPRPELTENFISLEEDYFAEYFEAQAKIFTEIAKKIRGLKTDQSKRLSKGDSDTYRQYLDQVASSLSGIKNALGDPLDEPIIKANMMRQLIVSNRTKGDLIIRESKNKKLKVLKAQEDNLTKGEK